jgi:hypothetical protein
LIASIIASAAPLDRPVEPCAEQRIDNEISADEARGLCRLDRAGKTSRCLCGVALELVALAKEQQPDRIAALGEDARADKTVAAVVARACHHAHRAGRMPRHRVCDRASGLFHQPDAGGAALDRQAIGRRHLRRGQELDHGGRHYRRGQLATTQQALTTE